MLRTNPKLTTLDGGSLGSWVEEDRGETRELMVIAKFSRDSIDMSNAHCGDCLAGAIGSISVTCVYDSITLYRCSPVDPAELWWPLGTVTPLRSVLLKYVLAGTEERRTRVAALQPVPHTRSHFESSPGASSRHSHSSVGTVVPTPCLALLGEAAMVGRCRHS